MDIDWNIIIAAIIGSLPGGFIAWRTGKAVDGSMHKLLKASEGKATAEATIAAGAAQARKAPRAKAGKARKA